MYNHQIRDMIDHLVEGGVINEDKTEDVFKSLLSYWHNKTVLIWSDLDIKSVFEDYYEAKFNKLDLTSYHKGEFLNLYTNTILEDIADRHDANIGVSWDVVSFYMLDYVEEYLAQFSVITPVS